jgi:predicted phosphodiesterase
MPQETMARLLHLDIPVRFIHGNGDRVVLAQLHGTPIDEVPPPYRESIAWTADRLDTFSRRSIAEWPPTCTIDVDGVGEVLFCHATARNDVDCFTRMTPDDRVARLFAGVRARVVVCGHTHMQFDRTVGTLRIVNAGSVGVPFAPPAGAHWLRLGPGVELRQPAASRESRTKFSNGTAASTKWRWSVSARAVCPSPSASRNPFTISRTTTCLAARSTSRCIATTSAADRTPPWARSR